MIEFINWKDISVMEKKKMQAMSLCPYVGVFKGIGKEHLMDHE